MLPYALPCRLGAERSRLGLLEERNASLSPQSIVSASTKSSPKRRRVNCTQQRRQGCLDAPPPLPAACRLNSRAVPQPWTRSPAPASSACATLQPARRPSWMNASTTSTSPGALLCLAAFDRLASARAAHIALHAAAAPSSMPASLSAASSAGRPRSWSGGRGSRGGGADPRWPAPSAAAPLPRPFSTATTAPSGAGMKYAL